MLQRTVERVLPLKPKRILVITNLVQAEETERQLAHYHKVPIDVIAEPLAKNTAPAIGLAATIIAAHDPQGVMVVLPADHFIRDEQALHQALQDAAPPPATVIWPRWASCLAPRNRLRLYRGRHGSGAAAALFRSAASWRKPPLEEALRYLEEGNFFWNSGMFIWRADTILSEINAYLPELAGLLSGSPFRTMSWELSDLEQQIASVYASVASVSIDYGVMERSSRVQVVPVEMGWSDVGSWSSLPEVVAADNSGDGLLSMPPDMSPSTQAAA